MDSDWTASALFSPSKARAQQAQAKDWAAVDAWLVKRYGSRLPAFERNEETLQSLLTLANMNESADEQRGQIERIEKAALQAMSRRQSGIAEEVFQGMQLELASETHLDTLAETVVTLGCPTIDASEMGKQMVDLTASDFELSQQVQRAEAQVESLRREQALIKRLLDELNVDAFLVPQDTVENTAEWMRTSKQLKAKIAEYEERLSARRPSTATIDIVGVRNRATSVSDRHAKLAILNAELQAYQDLPADPRAARKRLEEARDQLRGLTQRRDRLFESLVER